MIQKENRRRFPRVTVPPDAQLRCFGDSFRGRVRILGEGGMFIDTIHATPDGTEQDVVIEAGESIQVRCVTRVHEPGWGMGVEFVAMHEADRARIRELIARFAG